jgi:hypothetical protein
MKYLGLIIDSQWSFEPHFKQLVPKVTTAANALCGLLPNLGGAGLGLRHLYEGVIRSRVLCGAPIWAEDLSASQRSLALVRGLHRMTTIRIIRGYRTISYASATVLAAPTLSSYRPSLSKEDTRAERSCYNKDPFQHPSPLSRR